MMLDCVKPLLKTLTETSEILSARHDFHQNRLKAFFDNYCQGAISNLPRCYVHTRETEVLMLKVMRYSTLTLIRFNTDLDACRQLVAGFSQFEYALLNDSFEMTFNQLQEEQTQRYNFEIENVELELQQHELEIQIKYVGDQDGKLKQLISDLNQKIDLNKIAIESIEKQMAEYSEVTKYVSDCCYNTMNSKNFLVCIDAYSQYLIELEGLLNLATRTGYREALENWDELLSEANLLEHSASEESNDFDSTEFDEIENSFTPGWNSRESDERLEFSSPSLSSSSSSPTPTVKPVRS